MKENYKLIAITIVFVLIGLILAFVTLRGSDLEVPETCFFERQEFATGEEVIGYQEGNYCVCGKGGIVECVPLETDDSDVEPFVSTTDLETEGLEFGYSYLTGIYEEETDVVIAPIRFTSVSISEDVLSVVLEQKQICARSNDAPEQVGFYEEVDGVVKLYNMIRPVIDEDSIDCVVEVRYEFEDFSDFDVNDMQVAFVDDGGEMTYATICIYGQNVYSEDDVFVGKDDLMYTCVDGEVILEETLSD